MRIEVHCTPGVNLGLILAVRVAGVGFVQMSENTDSRGSHTHSAEDGK